MYDLVNIEGATDDHGEVESSSNTLDHEIVSTGVPEGAILGPTLQDLPEGRQDEGCHWHL